MSVNAISTRPTPGTPRRYEFPAFDRQRFGNGLTLLTVNVPGRPLLSATLLLRNGAADEPDAEAGSTVLAARALSEGTEKYDAIGLTEAAERLGASIHAEANWDAMSVGLEVPAARLEPALELVVEMVGHPTFPVSEVERLRDERLNDILQARADPRRRAEEALGETLYTSDSPYRRPASGVSETVSTLNPELLRRAYARGLDPAQATFIVAGDLVEVDVTAIVERLFGDWVAWPGATVQRPVIARSALDGRKVRLVHRAGSVQTEVRIGHPALPRRIPDYHAVSMMAAILGGLFNSRLNMKLREEKGYTYGAGAGFDMRRGPGPFAVRAAVSTDVTVPAIADILTELERMRSDGISEDELASARDFLVGVFPLRFETPGPIVGALSGIVIYDLPDDELARYRESIEAVTVADVNAAAEAHLHPDRAAVVLVGDADVIAGDLEAAGFGPLEVVRDEGPQARGPLEGVEEELGPVDVSEG